MSRAMALVMCGLWAAPLLGGSPDPKDLAIPPEELSKARDLIRRLGSEVYREREEAQVELAKMGRMARPVLLEAASTDPDPEVRFRSSRLLPKAGADDLKARLDTFLADTESKYDHNLPGLKQFRKIVGSDKLARDLFVDIIKSPYNVELLQMLDKSSVDAGRAISDRRMGMYSLIQARNVGGRIQPAQPIPLQDIACLIFAETVIPTKEIPRNNMWSYVTGAQFITQPSSTSAINNNGTLHSEAYKRILGQWMESREDVTDLNQLAYPVGQFLRGFKESVPLLRRIVTTEGVQGYIKGQALTYLVQQRKKEEYDFLRSLLTNDALVTTVFFGIAPNQAPMQHQCLLRDVALATLIDQTGQKMVDYGFSFPQGHIPNGQILGTYAFPTEEARAAAMVKFAFWRMKQFGKEPASATPTPKDAPGEPGPPPKKK
ncbi:MAG TPA: hypothetical protein VG122_00190 [Gemmata sp.]|nr:hypothetical protein [Gemmata sp.]